jgi:predicted amidophosphoribosyltransferase
VPFGNLLVKQKNTFPQAEIKKQKDRQKNIEQAFFLIHNPPALEGKNVLLIDDICTTGATLEECAKTLKPLKPKEIWGLVLARG